MACLAPDAKTLENGVKMDDARNHYTRNRLQRVVIAGLSVLAIAGATAIGGLAGTAQASTISVRQYAPPPPVAPAPPGFSAVVTSVTIGPAGGTVGPVVVDGADVTLTVPAGAFPSPVQITITAGDLGTLTPAVYAGYRIVTAVGVQVQLNGAAYPGTFLKALTLTVRDSAVTSASVVTTWNGASLTTDPAATTAPGVATVSFDTDPDFVVLSPVSTVAKPVPSATVPVTGKPLVGEGILAGVLFAAGLGGLGMSRRRKARG